MLLLKDVGCSSNAARVCQLYLADDLSFKRDFKLVGTSISQVLGFVLSFFAVDRISLAHEGGSHDFIDAMSLFRFRFRRHGGGGG